MNADEHGEKRLTTDRDTIMQWAEEHDVVPVQMNGTETTVDDSNPYRLRAEAERTEMMETASWDKFFQQLDDNDMVIVFHGEGASRPMETMDRDLAVSRAPLEASELEERLLDGEMVTSELTETTVIERTIVEHATIESEIVDTEVLDSRVIDVELRSREISGCDVIDRDVFDEVDHSRFEDISQLTEGHQEELPRSAAVEVDVNEDWTVTREQIERATIESRIVDVDVTETDTVESETRESSVEIEGVQQALLESDIIETEADAEEIISSGTMESEFHSDNIVQTQLTQRKVVEDTVTEKKFVRGELTDSEIRQAEVRESTSIETSFFAGETLDAEVDPVGVTEYDTETADAGTEEGEYDQTGLTDDDQTGLTDDDQTGLTDDDQTGLTDDDQTGLMEDDQTRLTDDDRSRLTDDDIAAAESGTARSDGVRTEFTEDDEGKPVVDSEGDAIGLIEEVSAGKAYMNPEPGIVDRIRSKLGWSEAGEGDFVLEEENIERIGEDEVELKLPR